jgi:tetratricopeptide (TPR) repeat protein
MASSREVLQRAIEAARAGRRGEARDVLIELVEVDPHNEMAWMWLSGLVDTLEDRIVACENVLTINPANAKVRDYLEKLQRQYEAGLLETNRAAAVELLNRAKACAEQKDRPMALQLATQAVEKREDYEEAWLLIARVAPDMDQRIEALETAARLNPSNAKTSAALERARYLQANPMSAALRLEQSGKYEDAIRVYEGLAGKAKTSQDFDHIYKQITRLEALRKENIRHVAPSSSIARLTFGWPVLYFSLAFVQMGLNPFKHPTFYSWLGLPLVIAGSFLLSLAEVRSDHIVWQKLFAEQGEGSSFARLAAAAIGWFLILVPHLLLLLDSLSRLQNFRIPPMPL